MATFTMTFRDMLSSLGAKITYTNMEFNGASFGLLPTLNGGEELVTMMFDHYPIHDEAYRPILNGKIIDHFFMQEIGHESRGYFGHRFRTVMNEIMPIYSRMYEDITFDDAMNNIDMVTESEDESTNTATSQSASKTKSTSANGGRTVNLDFPQTALADNADYATSGVDSTSTSGATGESDDTANTTNQAGGKAESRTRGRQGSAVDALANYRANLRSADLLIIGELRPLFMSVLDNGDNWNNAQGRNLTW